MLDLPEDITRCLLDLDGALTQTAEIHADAARQDGADAVVGDPAGRLHSAGEDS